MAVWPRRVKFFRYFNHFQPVQLCARIGQLGAKIILAPFALGRIFSLNTLHGTMYNDVWCIGSFFCCLLLLRETERLNRCAGNSNDVQMFPRPAWLVAVQLDCSFIAIFFCIHVFLLMIGYSYIERIPVYMLFLIQSQFDTVHPTCQASQCMPAV